MSKLAEADFYGTNLSVESMKVIAESIGIANLQDEAARELADEISSKLKHLVQDAAKFMHHSKRIKLTQSDVDHALKMRNIEPQYGMPQCETLPFRFASGGGRELHFIEEKEICLNDIVQNTNAKPPFDVSLRSHWLCIDGVQPSLPENPPPAVKKQETESKDAAAKKMPKNTSEKPTTCKQKLRNVETVQIKQLATHELSVEQQMYYKEITETCMGSSEDRRNEAFYSLSHDPGLHELMPHLCTFITENVRMQLVHNNLALLIYLMRMVRVILENPAIYLEAYLHDLIPSIISCVVAKQLALRPEIDNHWALRNFAGKLIAQICKKYSSPVNNIQGRIIKLYDSALKNCDRIPTPSLYGGIEGLIELGPEVVKTYVLPKIKNICLRIQPHLDSLQTCTIDKVSSEQIKQLLIRAALSVYRNSKSEVVELPTLEECREEYGYLGLAIYNAITNPKVQTNAGTSSLTGSTGVSSASVGGLSRSVGASYGLMQQNSATQRITMNQPSRGPPSAPSGGQKIYYVTQRSTTTPSAVEVMQHHHQTSSSASQQNAAVVKFVTANSNTFHQSKFVNSTHQQHHPQKVGVAQIVQDNQPSIGVISKGGGGGGGGGATFQQLQKFKVEQQSQLVDDLSHLT